MDDVTPELRQKYQELDTVIQQISLLEGLPDGGLVTQWAVVVGVVAFDGESGYMDNDVQVLTPNAGLTTPVWQAKGLLDSGLTKYRALEQHNFIANATDCDCDGDEGH